MHDVTSFVASLDDFLLVQAIVRLQVPRAAGIGAGAFHVARLALDLRASRAPALIRARATRLSFRPFERRPGAPDEATNGWFPGGRGAVGLPLERCTNVPPLP
jgi:hypothetical protein